MRRSMAFISSILILVALTSNANAEELWGCNAFTASRDGSKLSPFVLRGGGDTYFWRGEYSDKRIKKVAENRVLDFDIFVDVTSNTSRSAYYIQKKGTNSGSSSFSLIYHISSQSVLGSKACQISVIT